MSMLITVDITANRLQLNNCIILLRYYMSNCYERYLLYYQITEKDSRVLKETGGSKNSRGLYIYRGIRNNRGYINRGVLEKTVEYWRIAVTEL